MVRPIAEPSDLLCIFSGISVPFVLRKIHNKKRAYRLVGQAYVNGLMYGEAFNRCLECNIDGDRIECEEIALYENHSSQSRTNLYADFSI